MAKFHVNPKTGNTGKCRSILGRCPFGEEFHASSQKEAELVYENYMDNMSSEISLIPVAMQKTQNIYSEKSYARLMAENAWDSMLNDVYGKREDEDDFVEHEWERMSSTENLAVESLQAHSAINLGMGGIEATVKHDVGKSSIVVLNGGGARAEIGGDVKAGAMIGAGGGSATIIVHGNVETGAHLIAQGGGATIIIDGDVQAGAEIIAVGGQATVSILGENYSSQVNARGGAATVNFGSHKLHKEIVAKNLEK